MPRRDHVPNRGELARTRIIELCAAKTITARQLTTCNEDWSIRKKRRCAELVGRGRVPNAGKCSRYWFIHFSLRRPVVLIATDDQDLAVHDQSRRTHSVPSLHR